jgi:hypothetical protein
MSTLLGSLLIVAAQAATGTTAADLEARLFAAVFHQQKTELLDAEARAQGVVLCLAIDPGGAPQSVSAESLKALGLGPAVRRGAECEVQRSRAVEIATKRTAIVVTVGPVEWVKPDEAWVTVTQTWSASRSLRNPYRGPRTGRQLDGRAVRPERGSTPRSTRSRPRSVNARCLLAEEGERRASPSATTALLPCLTRSVVDGRDEWDPASRREHAQITGRGGAHHRDVDGNGSPCGTPHVRRRARAV